MEALGYVLQSVRDPEWLAAYDEGIGATLTRSFSSARSWASPAEAEAARSEFELALRGQPLRVSP